MIDFVKIYLILGWLKYNFSLTHRAIDWTSVHKFHAYIWIVKWVWIFLPVNNFILQLSMWREMFSRIKHEKPYKKWNHIISESDVQQTVVVWVVGLYTTYICQPRLISRYRHRDIPIHGELQLQKNSSGNAIFSVNFYHSDLTSHG